MEKAVDKLQPRSRLKIRVTPSLLREAASRIEQEAKNNTLRNQEVELDFSGSVSFVYEPEPVAQSYESFSSDNPGKKNPIDEHNSIASAPVLN